MSSVMDIRYYRQKYLLFMTIMDNFDSVGSMILSHVRKDNIKDSLMIQFRMAMPSAGIITINLAESTKELLLWLYVSLMLFIWQHAKRGGLIDNMNEIIDMTKRLCKEEMKTTNFVASFEREINSKLIYNDMNTSSENTLVFIRLLRERVMHMNNSAYRHHPSDSNIIEHASMFVDTNSLYTKMDDLCTSVKAFDTYTQFKPFVWVSLPMKIIGIIMCYLIPPLFYSVMGEGIKFVGPVVFLMGGSVVLLNFCLSDPFSYHTTWHMAHVNQKARDMANNLYHQYSIIFPHHVKQTQNSSLEMLSAIKNQVDHDVAEKISQLLKTQNNPNFLLPVALCFLPDCVNERFAVKNNKNNTKNI